MKTLLFVLFILSFSVCAQAQNGLERIIVEKYYVSDGNDEQGSNGNLSVGSVTYRIFVDMLPDHRFQAVYGVPGHELHLSTSTHFFNNIEYGASSSNEIHGANLNSRTVMLDSWLSVGAGADNYYAIPKALDTTQANSNLEGLLQNINQDAGIPIKIRDGLYSYTPVPVINFYNIDSTLLLVFNSLNSGYSGQSFSTDNGSWASFGGTTGLDSTNCVLVGQFTTNGKFSFELNIQIGTPYGAVENYVARNPKGQEIQFDGLVFPPVGAKKIPKNIGKVSREKRKSS